MKYIKVAVLDDYDPELSSLKDSIQHEWEPIYKPLLDHGYVGLVDFMGSDDDIAESARTSYAKGTKKVRQNAGLIRYLLSHRHTTPFEMCEVKFHVKAPILVFRQWHRHRTASINEMSGRYSVLDNEMYIPAYENTAPQSVDNKQGRSGRLSEDNYRAIVTAIQQNNEDAYATYEYLLGRCDDDGNPIRAPMPDAISVRKNFVENAAVEAIQAKKRLAMDNGTTWNPTKEEFEEIMRTFYEANDLYITSDDYPGLAREMARSVLPVSTYTQMYWKSNLWNTFNFLRLRLDAHAQYEIRVYAETMYDMIAPLFPAACEAFEDYIRQAMTLSGPASKLLARLINNRSITGDMMDSWLHEEGKKVKMTAREVNDLIKWIKSN